MQVINVIVIPPSSDSATVSADSGAVAKWVPASIVCACSFG